MYFYTICMLHFTDIYHMRDAFIFCMSGGTCNFYSIFCCFCKQTKIIYIWAWFWYLYISLSHDLTFFFDQNFPLHVEKSLFLSSELSSSYFLKYSSPSHWCVVFFSFFLCLLISSSFFWLVACCPSSYSGVPMSWWPHPMEPLLLTSS